MRLSENWIKILSGLFLFLIGVFVILFGTQKWGAGINEDSISYIECARSFSKGFGLNISVWPNHFQAMTHSPPFFSILLSSISLLGLDPVVGVRILNAFLFGGFIVLIGLMVYSYHRFWGLAVLAMALVLTSKDIIEIHCMAYTEPLSNFLIFSGIFLLSEYLYDSKRFLLLISAFVVGVESLTKFAGVPLIFTSIVSLIFLFPKRKELYLRIKDAFIFAFIAALPLMGWVFRNFKWTGRFTDRSFGFHMISSSASIEFWKTLEHWAIFQNEYLFVLFLIILYFLREREFSKSGLIRKHRPMPELVIIFACTYVIFLIISRVFLDRTTPFDSRILSPVYISLIIFSLCVIGDSRIFIKNSFCIILILMAGLSYKKAFEQVIYFHENGLKFSSAFSVWEDPGVMDEIKNLPDKTLLYTNVSALQAYFYYKKDMYPLPPLKSIMQSKSPAVAKLKNDLLYKKAKIIFFVGELRGQPTLDSKTMQFLNIRVSKVLYKTLIYETIPIHE